MSKKITKNKRIFLDKIIQNKKYSFEEAFLLLKETNFVKFDSSVDISVRLNINTRLPDQMLRGSVLLPHGTGRKIKILALVTKDKELESKKAGADYVGLDDYIEKIKSGWKGMDIIVAMPTVMSQLSPIGKILGPIGLMPNPKMETISMNPKELIRAIRLGKIIFKADRYGIVHSSIGKISFNCKDLLDNVQSFMNQIIKNKPSSSKGTYIKSIYLSTTMSFGLLVDLKSLVKK
ncbi:50S ribosomal protein L1 [Blattabacterium cuenoti]|uniref:50S ribosomal protein L1 n=1 Tax=Blattabacterium cuenoti TaxID=1653831 RepID=UPI00163BE920|nr:50S ribosomal protein L1 [Blattabacterium cuenoti]